MQSTRPACGRSLARGAHPHVAHVEHVWSRSGKHRTNALEPGGVAADHERLRVRLNRGPAPHHRGVQDGEFLADIPIVISDSKGNSLFGLVRAGPMLYVMLPQGRYKVSARFNGVTRTQQVTLEGGEGKDLYLHWGHANAPRLDGSERLIQSSLNTKFQ